MTIATTEIVLPDGTSLYVTRDPHTRCPLVSYTTDQRPFHPHFFQTLIDINEAIAQLPADTPAMPVAMVLVEDHGQIPRIWTGTRQPNEPGLILLHRGQRLILRDGFVRYEPSATSGHYSTYIQVHHLQEDVPVVLWELVEEVRSREYLPHSLPHDLRAAFDTIQRILNKNEFPSIDGTDRTGKMVSAWILRAVIDALLPKQKFPAIPSDPLTIRLYDNLKHLLEEGNLGETEVDPIQYWVQVLHLIARFAIAHGMPTAQFNWHLSKLAHLQLSEMAQVDAWTNLIEAYHTYSERHGPLNLRAATP